MIPEKLKSIIRKGIFCVMRDSLDIYNNMAYIQTLHQQTFGEYYNCNQGKDVVIVGSGPTVKNYNPIPGAIHIGVNNTYLLKEKIPFKYMFMQDYCARKDVLMGILNMDCTKFIGRFLNDTVIDFSNREIPESLLVNSNIKRYFVQTILNPETIKASRIYPDIRFHNLIDFGTTVHTALHFALFTNPKRIYLVGCDTNSAGHFNVMDKANDSILDEGKIKIFKAGYNKMKEVAMYHYPETEIISINPVGLKGLFIDEYKQ